jgi:hypothetical protein
MVTHRKTTIELSDHLLLRTKMRAKEKSNQSPPKAMASPLNSKVPDGKKSAARSTHERRNLPASSGKNPLERRPRLLRLPEAEM